MCLYYFRDERGLEVDFVEPHGGGLRLLEVKWTRTITPSDARPLQQLAAAIGNRPIEAWVVHRASRTGPDTSAVTAGVRAVTVEKLLGESK